MGSIMLCLTAVLFAYASATIIIDSGPINMGMYGGEVGMPSLNVMGVLSTMGVMPHQGTMATRPVQQEPCIYLLTFKITCGKYGVTDIPGTSAAINMILSQPAAKPGTRCQYKFKVTGEPKVIAVVEVYDVIALERQMAQIAKLGCVDTTCEPLSTYENFWGNQGLNPALLQPSSNTVQGDNEVTWCTLNLDYNGKDMSFEQFRNIWAQEAEFSFRTRASGTHLNLYKVQSQLRKELFVKLSVSDYEVALFQTPMVLKNGDDIKYTCRGVTSLAYYVTRMGENMYTKTH